MGKNKNRGRGPAASRLDDSDDDSFSTTSSTGASASSDVMVNYEPERERDDESVLEDFIDSLYEKRSSTREAGLKGLINSFTARVMTEFVEQKYETLTHQFLVSVKRGSASEAALACHALGLASIVAGAGVVSEQIFQESAPHLTKLLKTGSSPLARIAAIEALAVLTFIGGNDVAATDDSMEIFWQICAHKGNAHADQTLGVSKPTPAVKAAAMVAWTLLLSTLSSDQILRRQFLLKLSVFSSLLDVQDLGLRKATGEAVALLCEVSDYFAFEEGVTAEAKELQVVEQIKALAIDASRQGQSKKEKAEQRSSFREMLSTIEEGVCRETCLKLQHGDSLRVSSWTQTVQLNVFRRFLADGFQKHMQENILLHEIFDFVPRGTKPTAQTTKEKRMYMSPNSAASKLRTQEMNRKRAVAGRNFVNEAE